MQHDMCSRGRVRTPDATTSRPQLALRFSLPVAVDRVIAEFPGHAICRRHQSSARR